MPASASPSRRSWFIGFTAIAAIAALAVALAATGPISAMVGRVAASEPAAGWLVVGSVLFLAAILSSVVGFAFSAIAGAILFHVVPDGVQAVQIMMLASMGIQAYTVAALHRSIDWPRCLPFIVGGVMALPIGVMLLLALPARAYLLTIGATLIAYGLYMQLSRRAPRVAGSHRLLDVAVGAAGGITGPLAAFPAACLVIWCGARGWDKLAQRAVYQPYILVMQVLALALVCAERPSSIDPALLACILPGVAGAMIGLRVFRALTECHFQRLINLALIGSGVALLVK